MDYPDYAQALGATVEETNTGEAHLPEVAAQLMRQAGFKVDLQAMDWQTLVARRAKKDPIDKGGWHIFHTYSVGYDVISPVNNAYLQGTCDAAPAPLDRISRPFGESPSNSRA